MLILPRRLRRPEHGLHRQVAQGPRVVTLPGCLQCPRRHLQGPDARGSAESPLSSSLMIPPLTDQKKALDCAAASRFKAGCSSSGA